MDPVDRVIVDNSPEHTSKLLVVDAPDLLPEALNRAEEVLVWCDNIADRRIAEHYDEVQILDEASEIASTIAADTTLVWLRLPKALGALDEYAELIAASASDDVVLLAGGREKYLNRSMNEVLEVHFENISATLGQQKSRALRALEPKPSALTWPREKHHTKTVIGQSKKSLTLWAHGATFNLNKIDQGTSLLLAHADQIADADSYLDMGCGNGILATALAKLQPTSKISALDSSWAGVDATRRTAQANGVEIEVFYNDRLNDFVDQQIDVIVTNPPFHQGTAKQSGPTLRLFDDAARVLSDGGEFWCVFNSHLPWKKALAERIGETRVVDQNNGYTLTRSIRQR